MNPVEMSNNYFNDRPTLDEHDKTPGVVEEIANGEFDELREALEGGNKEEIKQEAGDALFMLLAIARVHGFDLMEVYADKIAEMQCRYNASFFQTGTYEEGMEKMLAIKKQSKKDFYSIET